MWSLVPTKGQTAKSRLKWAPRDAGAGAAVALARFVALLQHRSGECKNVGFARWLRHPARTMASSQAISHVPGQAPSHPVRSHSVRNHSVSATLSRPPCAGPRIAPQRAVRKKAKALQSTPSVVLAAPWGLCCALVHETRARRGTGLAPLRQRRCEMSVTWSTRSLLALPVCKSLLVGVAPKALVCAPGRASSSTGSPKRS
jgi:hypothetical protein